MKGTSHGADPRPTMTLQSFLQQPGRKRWTDEMRRGLVLQIRRDRGYTGPAEVNRSDFGKYSAAFRIKRFGNSHQTMIGALFPERGSPKHEIGVVVLKQAASEFKGAVKLERPPWFWVAIANVVVFVMGKRVLGGLVQALTHLNTFLPAYLVLGNLAVAYRRTRLVGNGSRGEGAVRLGTDDKDVDGST